MFLDGYNKIQQNSANTVTHTIKYKQKLCPD